jgi:hypothetical protein
MQTGSLIAVGFGVAVIALAMALTRLFGRRRQRRGDINGQDRDGDAAATWSGIRQSGRDIDPD